MRETNNGKKNDLGTPRVPVLDQDMKPLMPTTPARARLLLKQKKASAYRNKLGIFCILLHKAVEPNNQPLALGIDPGSKFEGWSVVGAQNTVLNGMSEAANWVKDSVDQRRDLRRARRQRNCPRRAARFENRSKKGLPPSTKARWGAKLRIFNELRRVLPIQTVVVEDAKAITKEKCRKWNAMFSPLEHGKNWFYSKIIGLGLRLVIKPGQETKVLRDVHGLQKCMQKNKAVLPHMPLMRGASPPQRPDLRDRPGWDYTTGLQSGSTADSYMRSSHQKVVTADRTEGRGVWD